LDDDALSVIVQGYFLLAGMTYFVPSVTSNYNFVSQSEALKKSGDTGETV